jgi:hypothetical protein
MVYVDLVVHLLIYRFSEPVADRKKQDIYPCFSQGSLSTANQGENIRAEFSSHTTRTPHTHTKSPTSTTGNIASYKVPTSFHLYPLPLITTLQPVYFEYISTSSSSHLCCRITASLAIFTLKSKKKKLL